MPTEVLSSVGAKANDVRRAAEIAQRRREEMLEKASAAGDKELNRPRARAVRLAGVLAEEHGLRGFDAIHLASALWLRSALSGNLQFAGFEEKLDKAVRSAALTVAD
jgi:hypothetical protein